MNPIRKMFNFIKSNKKTHVAPDSQNSTNEQQILNIPKCEDMLYRNDIIFNQPVDTLSEDILNQHRETVYNTRQLKPVIIKNVVFKQLRKKNNTTKKNVQNMQNIYMPNIDIFPNFKNWQVFETYLLLNEHVNLSVFISKSLPSQISRVLYILKRYTNYSVTFKVSNILSFQILQSFDFDCMERYVEYCLDKNIDIHFYDLTTRQIII